MGFCRLSTNTQSKGDGSMKASELSDEGLAAILRAIAFTSNLLSDEKDYVREAADRLEEKGDEDEEMLLLRNKEVR